MTATCGKCRHTVPSGDNAVWCYGAPPTVTAIAKSENGNLSVNVTQPLLPNESRACAVFKRRWWPRGWWPFR